MKIHRKIAVFAAACLLGLASHAQATLLLSDNFNDDPNNVASTFNDNLASTQAGTLATVTYSVQGTGNAAQHSNGSALLVATFTGLPSNNGNVSLNNNFATQANTADLPLQISFNVSTVSSYSDTSRWVQFNVGDSQHLAVNNGNVGVGVLFRVNNGSQMFSGGSALAGSPTWVPDDLVTVTLSNTAGTGSAFNGNGSKATISIGASDFGPFTLAQQTNAFVTFSAFNFGTDQFGLGRFDNLNVSLVPEPSGLALLAFGSVFLWFVRERHGR